MNNKEKRLKKPDDWSPTAGTHQELPQKAPKEEPAAPAMQQGPPVPPPAEPPAEGTTCRSRPRNKQMPCCFPDCTFPGTTRWKISFGNEFSDEVPEETASDLAMQLLPECESIFYSYPFAADFALEPEYELLYTELTGTIALYLESHEL